MKLFFLETIILLRDITTYKPHNNVLHCFSSQWLCVSNFLSFLKAKQLSKYWIKYTNLWCISCFFPHLWSESRKRLEKKTGAQQYKRSSPHAFLHCCLSQVKEEQTTSVFLFLTTHGRTLESEAPTLPTADLNISTVSYYT